MDLSMGSHQILKEKLWRKINFKINQELQVLLPQIDFSVMDLLILYVLDYFVEIRIAVGKSSKSRLSLKSMCQQSGLIYPFGRFTLRYLHDFRNRIFWEDPEQTMDMILNPIHHDCLGSGFIN